MFNLIPTAEASVETLMLSINKVIINPIIILLFALATVLFMYGLIRYLFASDNENVVKETKQHMLWGILGMFIMISVFGIMRLILSTLGETKIKIDNSGEYQIER
jgi:lysylphosphatidylglycerol synthetase-like protein (DUF2156 family)